MKYFAHLILLLRRREGGTPVVAMATTTSASRWLGVTMATSSALPLAPFVTSNLIRFAFSAVVFVRN